MTGQLVQSHFSEKKGKLLWVYIQCKQNCSIDQQTLHKHLMWAVWKRDVLKDHTCGQTSLLLVYSILVISVVDLPQKIRQQFKQGDSEW